MSVKKYNPTQIYIQLKPQALAHFHQQGAKQHGIYLSTEKAGCSGYAYVTELMTPDKKEVVKAETNADFAIYVATDSVERLRDLTIDIEMKTLGQKSLIFINPNEKARCGCGESFTPKDKV